jgi:hypothetical protein
MQLSDGDVQALIISVGTSRRICLECSVNKLTSRDATVFEGLGRDLRLRSFKMTALYLHIIFASYLGE